PLLAVCTHGRHDLCCAVRGRPVARELATAWPANVVEVTHLGGHRFAPTVLVLPGGHYLGRLDAQDAVAACAQVLTGVRPDPHYRGRAAFARPVQAALHFAAQGLGIRRLAALTP